MPCLYSSGIDQEIITITVSDSPTSPNVDDVPSDKDLRCVEPPSSPVHRSGLEVTPSPPTTPLPTSRPRIAFRRSLPRRPRLPREFTPFRGHGMLWSLYIFSLICCSLQDSFFGHLY